MQGKPEGNPNSILPFPWRHFLCRIEPFQWLTPTLTAFFLFEADSGFLAPHESRRCVFA
jgi:hypothetical protein